MPYVEVWVDHDCDGSCKHAKDAQKETDKLDAVIKEAERLLRLGYADAALHALTNDAAIPVKAPESIAQNYEAWKRGKLRGFTNYKPEATP